jgi:hypothetical protein
MSDRPSRSSTVYNVAFGVLVVFLALGALLFMRLIGNDDGPLDGLVIGRPQATDCPVGQRAPLCYQFDVTNTGDSDAAASCAVLADPGMTALFLNGDVKYVASFISGQTISLVTKVDATEGNTVSAPTVQCGTV